MEKIEFRLSKLSDNYAIVDLLTLSSSHLRTIRYWEWINTKECFPGSFVVVATYSDKIIGHYAVSVRDYSVFGSLKRVGIATQTVIHPSFRNLQILLDISNFVKGVCLEIDLYMVIGFPNDNLYKINTKFLGWERVSDVGQFEVSLNQLPVFKLNNKILRVLEFNDNFNRLIDFNNDKNNDIKECISIDCLNWRYFEHPLNNYVIFSSISDSNNLNNGYIVLKIYHSNTGVKGHIVELLTYNDSAIMDSLLGVSIEYFKWANCSSISVWVGKNNYKYNYFKNIGFNENSIKSHLQVLPLGEAYNEVLDIDSWDLAMKMSDAY
jgi:hypothetical protein